MPFKKPSESLRCCVRRGEPRVGQELPAGFGRQAPPVVLGTCLQISGSLGAVHPHSQKDQQEQSTGSSRILWILNDILTYRNKTIVISFNPLSSSFILFHRFTDLQPGHMAICTHQYKVSGKKRWISMMPPVSTSAGSIQ